MATQYDDAYYANERAKILAELAKNPVSYTGMGGIEGSLAPNLPRVPESNYVSADLRINVRNILKECHALLMDIDRADTKNKKNDFLKSIFEKLTHLKTMAMDPDNAQELKQFERKYNYKQQQISAMPDEAMPDEAMPAEAGGSRKRRKSKPKKSRKTKSRKTKSRRH